MNKLEKVRCNSKALEFQSMRNESLRTNHLLKFTKNTYVEAPTPWQPLGMEFTTCILKYN